jgi:hypothetical protein
MDACTGFMSRKVRMDVRMEVGSMYEVIKTELDHRAVSDRAEDIEDKSVGDFDENTVDLRRTIWLRKKKNGLVMH